jgi:putative transcriptional regulator
MAESLAGKLLVASLRIVEPTFFRTVVLMCAHDEKGALGIVLNRPVRSESVTDHLPQYDRFTREPSCIFHGGPVEPTAALALASWQDADVLPAPNMVIDRTGLLDLSRPLEEIESSLQEVRVYAGYAGWGGGQVESELEEESWFVVDAEPGDIFSREPDDLWRTVLRRQKGKLAMFAWAPRDPAVN